MKEVTNMIDIKLIREDRNVVKENIKKKFQDDKLSLVDEVYEYDIEKAKQLLATTKYKDGFEFEVYVLTSDMASQQTLVIWQADLKEIGITMNINICKHTINVVHVKKCPYFIMNSSRCIFRSLTHLTVCISKLLFLFRC